MMMAKQEIPCPVCRSKSFTIKYEPTVDETDPAKLYGAASGIRGTQRLVECCDCSLLYENPRYPADVIIKGYMESKESGHDSQYPMRVRSFESALNKISAELPAKGAKVLDIGTAGGAFLDAAKNYGFDAWGMEPSEYLVAKGRDRGLQIEQGVIERHSFQENSFDMVTLWDVIEHLPDPLDSLCRIRSLLKPGGILLINIPDIDTWQARLFGKNFWWLISVHTQHFSPKTIGLICSKTGFQMFHVSPYWQILQFGYLEKVAAQLNVPGASLIEKITPSVIKNIPLPYYASQTTILARVS